MTRRSRSKGLPPKVQLRTKDSLAATYPTGRGYVTAFDDMRTVVFTSYPSMSMGAGLPSGSQYLTDELTTDMYSPGVLRKGVGDAWIDPQIETFTPFKDNDLPAVDGMSLNDVFYTTGSAVGLVGEGFDQPLWAKTKIEIDLTPSVSHSFFIQNYLSTSLNFPMAYWNNVTRKYEGIGLGREFAQYDNGSEITLKRLLEDQTIGFNGHFDNGGGNLFRDQAIGHPVSNFGYPYHPKFHATSSNLYPLSGTLSRPFLLEKVVLYFSGAYKHNNSRFGTNTRVFLSTFFILNQRFPFAYDNDAATSIIWKNTNIIGPSVNTLVSGVNIPATYNGTYVNTVRDVVTWMNVVGFNGGFNSLTASLGRELNITADQFGYRGSYIMSGTVKSAFPTNGMVEPMWTANAGQFRFLLNRTNSTRCDLFVPGGRSYLSELEKGDPNSSQTNYDGLTLITLDRYTKYNPYLLHPNDNLVFGWQVPWCSAFSLNDNDGAGGLPTYNGKGPELEFAAFPSKIVLYGSYVDQNHESHEGSTIDLTSLAAHEVIG